MEFDLSKHFVYHSARKGDTLEFTDYIEKCRLWANEFLGLNIPLPGEVTV